jgi:hypothetical protein
MFERDWITCSKFVNHCSLDSQHNWQGSVRPFNEKENRHFDSKEVIHMSSKNYEEGG